MRSPGWFVASAVALVAAVLCLWTGWHGTANLSFGTQISSAVVEITGAAHGGPALAAILLLVAAAVLFVVAVIRMLAEKCFTT